jgi:holo-[acyl-carrier protein] synthase
MIIGIGTDIALVARIRKLSAAAVSRLLTEKELAYCKRYTDPHVRITGRFAAKEAVLKALGTGLSGGISWRQIEILPDAKGAPKASFKGEIKRRLREMNATRCHISISHQGAYAAAFAVLENKF